MSNVASNKNATMYGTKKRRFMKKLQPGDNAPSFSLLSQDGSVVSLDDYRQRRIVLYFYPKDFTPGCTTQACDLRDEIVAGSVKNSEIVGISSDPPEVHKRFSEEYGLHFTLLSDHDNEVMKAYGAYGEKMNYGKTVVGVIRSTFIIGPDQKIESAFYAVKAKGHATRLVNNLNRAT